MFEARTPRIAEHTFQNTNNFRTDVGFFSRIGDFERVKGHWISRVGGVEINYVTHARFGDKSEVVDSKIAVRVNNTITLIVKNIRECKKFEHAAFPCSSLTNNINVTRAIATEQAKLMVDPSEISETKGGNVFVVGGDASENGELGGRFGGLGRSPDDIWRLDRGVREMINAGKL